MKKLLILTLCILLATPLFAEDKKPQNDDSDIVLIGHELPSFEYTTKKGETLNSKTLKGKVVMITFFATWCPPCRKELPHIEKEVWQKYKENSNFELLVFGREHNSETVAKFKQEQHFTMPMLADPQRDVYSKFAHQFIPRIYLIGRDGKVIYQSKNYSEKEFGKLKKQLVKELE